MVGASVGRLGPFDPEVESVVAYLERVELFFKANKFEDNSKVAVFLTLIRPSNYALLRNLLAPVKPADKSLDALMQALRCYHEPKKLLVAERFKFHRRQQTATESVTEYVAELRKLATHCKFGEHLQEALRDRLVCGLRSEPHRRQLLAEQDLTLNKALAVAQSLETAEENARTLRGEISSGRQSDSFVSRQEVSGAVGTTLTREVHKVTPANKVRPDHGSCYRCGRAGHKAAKCKFRDTQCYACGKTGNIKAACRSAQKTSSKVKSAPRPVRVVQEEEVVDYPLFHLGTASNSPPITDSVAVEKCPVTMEVDTGAALSLVSEATFNKLWPDKRPSPSNVRLCSYSGEAISVIGSMDVTVEYKGQVVQLPLIVVKGEGPSLCGRNWLQHLRLDWREIHRVQGNALRSVVEKHKALFQPGLGTLKGHKVKIAVDPEATPRFHKARPIPYAFKQKVEEELERLVEEGALEAVEFADWAAPIVPVLKSDQTSIRICGDFKQTVNPVSKLDRYPIPKIEDLFSTLAGGKIFSKIDLSQAYQQLPLDEESKQYVVINTHKGLFRYTRLPFGISSAPGIFQRVIESVLQGIPRVVAYLDDILVSGATQDKHLSTLEAVFDRLEEAGLRVQEDKCQFMVPSITYLGYQIDAEGLHPLEDKVQAVVSAPSPKNVQELKAYLGLLTYYIKFLPDLSTKLAPLYLLLRKNASWQWRKKQAVAFEASKELLTSSSFLVHFNPELKLILACDASAYGVGAVLAHQMPNGSKRPIGYASRTLTYAEKNYSQLEKEALACIFDVKRFHAYLFGHHFELVTDHQPLLALMSEYRSTSPQASARVRWWALFLSMYKYTLQFRKTEAHCNADALSHLQLPTAPKEVPVPPELVLLMQHLQQLPVTADHIRLWTRRDPVLAKVFQFVQHGWPNRVDPELAPFASRKTELSVHEGCLLWGARVVVPPQGKEMMLKELHQGHPGMSRMKSLARMYVWWPGLDKDIESSVQSCTECQATQSVPPSAPLHPWSWPTRRWSRLHVDYAGPFQGHMFLMVIDAHSKWIEAWPVHAATSSATIEKLRTSFAQFGLPETIVSDNGTCFVSEEFESFLQANGIKHVTSAPYHPSSNGLAERAVQILKNGLKKEREGSPQSRLTRILFMYRITPQSTTGVSPAELLLGWTPRSRLDLVRPNMAKQVEKKQFEQKASHDASSRNRCFQVGDRVIVLSHRPGEKWIPGHIAKITGPVSFQIQLEGGQLIRRHQDQIRHRVSAKPTEPMVQEREIVVDSSIVETHTEPPEARESSGSPI